MKIETLKDLKTFLRLGGRLKCDFHINPRATMAGKTRAVVKMTKDEWTFDDGAVMFPAPGSPASPTIKFTADGFLLQAIDTGLTFVSYTYQI